jgi:hypothetical protein
VSNRLRYILAFFTLLTIMGCSGENARQEGEKSLDASEHHTVTSGSDKAKVITLPTPMQIPALLRNTKAVYHPEVLLSITNDEKSYYKSGILFGMYMLDMAYAASFTHQQASMNYFKACKRIGDDLGLGVKITESHVERFNRNLTRPDSLGKIVLQMYDIGHKVLIDQEKEGLGFLMVMGCYMEGMNLVMEKARIHDLILFVHLLHQQQNYGNNLVAMLDQYEIPTEIYTEYHSFKQVVQILNALDVPTVYELKTGKRNIANMEAEKLEQMAASIAEFRKSILI